MIIQVCLSGLSPRCVSAMNRMRPKLLEHVLVPHLHFPANAKGADFCVEKCTYGEEEMHDAFCYVRLLDVSITPQRSPDDFAKAQEALERLYAETIEQFPPEKKRPVSLSARIVLNTDLNLVEAKRAREITVA